LEKYATYVGEFYLYNVSSNKAVIATFSLSLGLMAILETGMGSWYGNEP
jgi:hypothetical protein